MPGNFELQKCVHIEISCTTKGLNSYKKLEKDRREADFLSNIRAYIWKCARQRDPSLCRLLCTEKKACSIHNRRKKHPFLSLNRKKKRRTILKGGFLSYCLRLRSFLEKGFFAFTNYNNRRRVCHIFFLNIYRYRF